MTARSAIRYRPAREADLAACEVTWRDGLNDYLVPLGQYEVPPDNPSLRLLHAHTLATDPSRFWVATRSAPDGSSADAERTGGIGESADRRDGGAGGSSPNELAGPALGADGEVVVGFASAVRRDAVWFLSMLFVYPSDQAAGVGRTLLEHILPGPGDDAILSTATDAAQPISNGLYASLGIVPRLPMLNLVGRPTRPESLATLPDGVHPVRFVASAPAERDRVGDAELAGLDRATLGFAHREDHEFVRRGGRVGYAYRDGRGELLGYGYASEIGRIGPIAVRDAALQAPIVAHLLEAVEPRGVSAIWVPGAAGPTVEMLIRAGLRIEGFPVLVCWSRPFADFARYLPTSPGLL